MDDAEWTILTQGHPDDPKTWCAWIIALDGQLNVFNNHIESLWPDGGTPDGEHWKAMAAMFDGLDGAEIKRALEEAFDHVGMLNKAIEKAIDDYEKQQP